MIKRIIKDNTSVKLLEYLYKYKLTVLLSLLTSAAGVVCALYIPVKFGAAIDIIIGAGQVDFMGLKTLLLECAALALLSAVLQWASGIFNNKITFYIIRDIRGDAFSKLGVLPLSYIDAHPIGETVSKVISDVDIISEGLLLGFSQLFSGVVTIIVTLVFMLALQPYIALVVVVLTPLSLVMARFIAKYTHKFFHKQALIRGEQTAFIDEMISGLKTVKAFAYEKKSQSRFDEINERFEKSSLKAIFYSSLTNPAIRFITSFIYAAVAMIGAFVALGGNFTVGALTALLYFAGQYTKPFTDISVVITELQNAFVCASRVFSLIDEKPQTPDAQNAIALKDVRGEVLLEDVSFSYDKNRELIKGLNLSVESGRRVAIVGPTGSGKTTLINLLMRFYDVDSGKIFVDNQEIRTLTRRSLRANFGMVLQDSWLKAGTIRDNIVMGRKEATEAEIEQAAKAAYAHNFIKRLPQGYDTYIGEDGASQLSQGQKQLLCIARVMLALPPMLILDEATSSIDTRTELRVQDAFTRMMVGRTTFVVAHRLSTIREADLILVLKDGSIIEQGTHEGLMNKNGFYADLYNSQFTLVGE